MRPPTIILGNVNGYKFRIRYRQVPYVNRFFFVDIYNRYGNWDKEFMKIEGWHSSYELPSHCVFGFLISDVDRKKFARFLEKVRKYDDYLDKKD